MMPITCAKSLLPRGRSPSSPTTRHVRSNIRSTSISMPSAISWNVASQNSSSSAASHPASKRPPEITGPSSLSLPSSYGCGKCPHHLVNAHSQGRYLDDPALRVLWEYASGLDVPLYLHPANGVDAPHVLSGHPELTGPLWSWGNDTASHILRLVFSKGLRRLS